jgi:hypothetical protein
VAVLEDDENKWVLKSHLTAALTRVTRVTWSLSRRLSVYDNLNEIFKKSPKNHYGRFYDPRHTIYIYSTWQTAHTTHETAQNLNTGPPSPGTQVARSPFSMRRDDQILHRIAFDVISTLM